MRQAFRIVRESYAATAFTGEGAALHGGRWNSPGARVKQARSAVLELPCVIIPGESNFLLNTSHPDFKSITISKPGAFFFDSRLLP